MPPILSPQIAEDESEFYCRVSNRDGQVESRRVQLLVYTPALALPSENQWVIEKDYSEEIDVQKIIESGTGWIRQFIEMQYVPSTEDRYDFSIYDHFRSLPIQEVKSCCDFSLEWRTPDHSFFGRIRKKVGAKRLSVLFERIVDQARIKGIVQKLESFVDASAIKRKEALWEERDKARKGNKSLKNEEVSEFSADKEAKWGCKGKGKQKKYWFGYKRHVSVDTGSGLME